MSALQRFLRGAQVGRALFAALLGAGAALFVVASGDIRAAEKAGEAIFVIGEAKLARAGGERALVRGDAVEVGDVVTTAANGHVHLRMVDQGFVSVRPDSRLTLEAYHYDSAHPAENRVKYTLERGVVRTITGRAGEAARQNYRLNTPLAAIGVRGTDYAVQAAADVTRASVFRGAIVMAPLNGGCTADSFGPCSTPAARQLSDLTRNAYLELNAQSHIPELIPVERGKAPNRVSPPAPEEPGVDKSSRNDKGTPIAEVTAASSANQLQSAADSAARTQTPVISPPLPALAPPPAPPPALVWGRWSTYADPAVPSTNVLALVTPDREIAVSNPVFGLLRDRTTVQMPTSGAVNFALAGSEAYLQQGNKLLPANVTDPRLSVDFTARRFSTSLNVLPADASLTAVPISAAGSVTWQGYMISDPSADTQVVGALAGSSAQQAGYLFQKILPSSLTAIGATRWTR